MKKLFLALLALVLFPFVTNAQILWQKTYGPANGSSHLNRMIPLQNGGYLLAGGNNYSVFSSRTYLVRTNANGDTVWSRRYLPSGFDLADISDAAEDTDGNLILVGSGKQAANWQDYNGFILKLNPNGDTIWTKRTITPKTDRYTSIIIGNDGNYIICGQKNRANQLQKIGKNGIPVWLKAMQYSPIDTGVIAGAHPAPNGYFAFICSYNTSPVTTQVVRTDESGNSIFSFINYAYAPNDIITDINNDLLISASGRLFKLNPVSDTLWSRVYKIGNQFLGIRAAKLTLDGNYITAFDRQNGMDGDVGLMKTTINGDLIKDTVFFRSGNDETVNDIVVDANGDYVFAGDASLNGLNSNSVFFLTKHRKWNKVLGLNENKEFDLIIKLYPNPTSENAFLESNKLLTGNLGLYNLQGQPVWKGTGSDITKKSVPLQNLPPGIYILRYIGENGSQFSQKLIKQ